jgi:glycosyltransferase involved in cell wall biosynthesis
LYAYFSGINRTHFMPQPVSVSIVIPARNEQDNLPVLIREIHDALTSADYSGFDIVVVDDGSSDLTLEHAINTARETGTALVGIRHQTSVGQSGALQTGIRNAKGTLIVTMDGDGQNNPADIPALLKRAEATPQADFCIAGYRKNRKDTAWKRFQSKLANRVRNFLLHDNVPDTGCGLKLFPRATFLKLPWFDHGHRFIPALVIGIGGVIEVVEVGHRDRREGQSNYTAWNRAWSGILDLFGVIWLLHRTKPATIAEYRDSGAN